MSLLQKYFVINLKEREDKLLAFNRNSDMKMTRLDGVNLRKDNKPYLEAIKEGFHADVPLTKLGYVGVGLAHLNAWKRVSKEKKNAIIFEDDCKFKTNWHSNILTKLYTLYNIDPNFDLFLLNVLRSKGIPIAKNILKIDNSKKEEEPCPNVWLSCYILTPKGAKKLLTLFQHIRPNFNTTQIDRALIFGLYMSDIDAYCIDTTNLIIVHDEDDSDKHTINIWRSESMLRTFTKEMWRSDNLLHRKNWSDKAKTKTTPMRR